MADIWGYTLGIPVCNISIFDDYIALGGESLTVIGLSQGIKKIFNVDMSIGYLFNNSDFRTMLRNIRNAAWVMDKNIDENQLMELE